VRVTRDDGVELTFDNIVNDGSLYAYTAVMCWIESYRKNRIGIFFSESECCSKRGLCRHAVSIYPFVHCIHEFVSSNFFHHRRAKPF